MYNDTHSAELFQDMHKESIRYCRDLGGWFFYNGKVWQLDKNNQIKKYAIDVYKKLYEELQNMPLPNMEDDTAAEQYKLFASYVKNLGNDAKLNAMTNCAQAYLGEPSTNFDAISQLFNCNNGTIDLQQKKRIAFDQKHLLTKISPVDYISNSECPMWEKFVNDIFLGNEEIIEFMQRAVGYSMTESVKEHCMFIFYGGGRNGKTTFINIISEIFGTYAMNCPITTFITKQNPGIPNDIARLRGARIVTSSENNQNVTLDEAVIKQLTGGDRITARFLNKEFFEFTPTFKIFISTNHKPNIRGTDPGIWRKIRMIPFDLNVSIEQEDKELPERLRTELPGIFKWVINGYKKWSESGLQTPTSILNATNDYKYEEDDLGIFIEDYFDIEEDGYIAVSDFKFKFEEIMRYKKSGKTISEYMARRGYNKKDNRITLQNGDRIRAFTGLSLKPHFNHNKTGQKDYAATNWHD